MSRRRQRSVVATVLILAAAVGVLVAAVRLWKRAIGPPAPVAPGRSAAEGRVTPTATGRGAGNGEEITAEERHRLDDILRQRPRTP